MEFCRRHRILNLQLSNKTWAHQLSAGVKLVALCLISISILPVNDTGIMLGVLAAVLLLYVSLGKEAVRMLSVLRPLLPILAMLFALHLWVTDWQVGLVAVSRLLAMVLLANAVTMTTTMSDMMDAVIPLFSPFRRFGLQPTTVALAVALVLRFIPVLFAEWDARERSWRARGGGRNTWRLLPAYFLGVLQLSNNIGTALEARGFSRQNTKGKEA
ncbi:CbiQ family ECF transporter T component [Thalassospiraceae bacterium LMO-JJ14]|nr:CbiQ family ECF transporter T component [Thalassospiraceae bacterium LMO-JJ14]